MDWLKLGALIVAILIANNFLVFQYISDRFEPRFENPTEPDSAENSPQKAVGELADPASNTWRELETVEHTTNSDESVFPDNTEMILAVIRNYVVSDEFRQLIKETNLSQTEKVTGRIEEIKSLDSNELMDVLSSDASFGEKQLAKIQLISENLGELDIDELSFLYDQSDDGWSRIKVLLSMIEKDNLIGLGLAQEELTNQTLPSEHIGFELLPAIYDLDPDFVTDYLASLDYSDVGNLSTGLSMTSTAPEFANDFFQQNWKLILNSNNRSLLAQSQAHVELELSYFDQRELLAAITSSNRSQRQFAISLINNIDDIDALRDAYHELPETDQLFFRSMLRRDTSNSEAATLANELDRNS